MAGMTQEQLQSFMDSSPFIRFSGMTITAMSPQAETLTVSMPLREEFERGPGSRQFHGGPIASLIDTAGCYALIMQTAQPVPTINFRTDYLRPAVDTTLHATATVRRAGRTIGVVDVDVVDDSGKLLAVGRGSFGTQPG